MSEDETYARQQEAAEQINAILNREGYVLFGTIVCKDELPVQRCPACEGTGLVSDDPMLRAYEQTAHEARKREERLEAIRESKRYVFAEGDARCNAPTHDRNRQTPACLLAKGHEGPHRDMHGYWRNDG